MKTCLLIFLVGLIIPFQAQISLNIHAMDSIIDPKTGNDVLHNMHQYYKNAPCKRYTFSQKNNHYRNDSIIRTSKWHEYIEFPDKFRINFEDTVLGNFVIFKNDSAYRYKNNELKKTSRNANTLLLLLGGMYYRSLPDVIERLQKEGYNTNLISLQKRKKTSYFVIGALLGDTTSNQIWVNKKKYRVERIIEKIDTDHTMDMTFDSFQKLCEAFTETTVTFSNNGKLEQQEHYYHIKISNSFEDEIFNPKAKK
jgi:hypothetical protein